MTRTRARAALWLAIGALLCGAATARADVTVGVAVPRTGAVAGIGEQVLQGVQAAIRDANARGGIAASRSCSTCRTMPASPARRWRWPSASCAPACGW